MTSYETKVCPRCGKTFECKAGSVDTCGCSNVVLSVAETEYIKARYDDCLCVACLEDLKQEYVTTVNANKN